MPAIYTHYYFGKLVFSKLKGELKEIVKRYPNQFRIGLQGPDPLLYHSPFKSDHINEMGDRIHKERCSKFLKKAISVVRKEGIDSGEYAYLIGFLCHFALDSEVHPYVDEYCEINGVGHVYMETAFDKFVLQKEGKDPMKTDLSKIVPHDRYSAKCMSAFYDCLNEKKSLLVLCEMYYERKVLHTPSEWKYNSLETLCKVKPSLDSFWDLVIRKEDDSRCFESNAYLYKKLHESVQLAISLIYSLDDTIQNNVELAKRFNRDFETLK